MKLFKYLLTTILTSLFFVSIARAQVGSYGSDSLLDVGCWNLEWFGSTEYGPTNEALQFDNIKQVFFNFGDTIINQSNYGVTKLYSIKINYIHQNPVEEGYVFKPKEYRYSSAVDYSGDKGLLDGVIVCK